MSFDEEWAQVRAEAVQRQSTHTRLNQLPASGSGGNASPGKALHVTPHILKERAGKVAAVRGNFAKADDTAMKETGQVKASLKGFKSADAFSVFQKRWRAQMSYMHAQLEKGVAGALRKAATKLTEEDKEQANKYHTHKKN